MCEECWEPADHASEWDMREGTYEWIKEEKEEDEYNGEHAAGTDLKAFSFRPPGYGKRWHYYPQ